MAKKSTTTPATEATVTPIVLGVVPKGVLREIFLNDVIDPKGESDRMPREGDEDRVEETARSLREVGQLQPIMVETGDKEGTYVRVFGRRRLAAARLNKQEYRGPDTIMAIVVPPLAEDVRRTIVAVENIQRQDLSPAEEHLAVAELTEMQSFEAAIQVGVTAPTGMDFGKRMTREIADRMVNYTNRESTRRCANLLLQEPKVRNRASELVAAMLAKSVVWVRDRMYIGRLDGKARELVLHGRLPLQHAREIAKVADPIVRAELAKDYAAGGSDSISDTEPGEFDDLRHEVGQRLFSLGQVPWKLEVPFAGKVPCVDCPNNSTTNPGLFDHGGDVSNEMVGGMGRNTREIRDGGPQAGVCTLHTCFAVKLRAAKAAVSASAKRIVDDGRDPKKDTKVVPEFVAPGALTSKVKHRRLLKASKPKGSAGQSKTRSKPAADPVKDLQREAEAAFEAIWARKQVEATKLISAWAGKDALRVLAIETFLDIDEVNGAFYFDDVIDAMKKPQIARAIAKLKKPDLALLGELRQLREKRMTIDFMAAETTFCPQIAHALGLKIELPNDGDQAAFVKQYIAGKKAESDAPTKKPATKGKPAAASKSSGTSTAARSTKASGKKASSKPAKKPAPTDDDELHTTGATHTVYPTGGDE